MKTACAEATSLIIERDSATVRLADEAQSGTSSELGADSSSDNAGGSRVGFDGGKECIAVSFGKVKTPLCVARFRLRVPLRFESGSGTRIDVFGTNVPKQPSGEDDECSATGADGEDEKPVHETTRRAWSGEAREGYRLWG
jgi:hypothetical protein